VAPAASCQTGIFSGRSMPIVWAACISGVPPLALPNFCRSVGRNGNPTAAAPVAWSIPANTVRPYGGLKPDHRIFRTVIAPLCYQSFHCDCVPPYLPDSGHFLPRHLRKGAADLHH
jgi:hypothetical protein